MYFCRFLLAKDILGVKQHPTQEDDISSLLCEEKDPKDLMIEADINDENLEKIMECAIVETKREHKHESGHLLKGLSWEVVQTATVGRMLSVNVLLGKFNRKEMCNEANSSLE